MMAKNSHFLVFAMLVISACGRPQLNALSGASDQNPTPALKTLQEEFQLESASATDGSLGPLSDFDLKMDSGITESGLPFLSLSGFENSFSTFKSPAGSSSRAKGRDNVAGSTLFKPSNLIFRAIKQIPPSAAIKSVTRLKVRLSEVRIHADSEAALLKGQSFCVLDGRLCVGERPIDMAKDGSSSGGNPKFWSDARLYSTKLASTESFKAISSDEGAGAVYSSETGDLELDLLELFKLSGSEAIDFLFKNSELYSNANDGFRKFRFSIGDRILAGGGELILDLDLDAEKLPKDFSKRLPAPVHGASDMVHLEAKRVKKVLKKSDGLIIESEYLWILDEGNVSKINQKLEPFRAQIEKIHVVSLNASPASDALSQTVEKSLIGTGWPEAKIVASSKIEEGAPPSVGIQLSFVSEVEKNPAEKKKILNALLERDESGQNDGSSENLAELPSEIADIPSDGPHQN